MQHSATLKTSSAAIRCEESTDVDKQQVTAPSKSLSVIRSLTSLRSFANVCSSEHRNIFHGKNFFDVASTQTVTSYIVLFFADYDHMQASDQYHMYVFLQLCFVNCAPARMILTHFQDEKQDTVWREIFTGQNFRGFCGFALDCENCN